MMRKNSCAARCFGAAFTVLGLVLVATAVWYGALVHGCWRLQPSGNELYDRFARAVRGRQAPRLYGGLGPGGVLLAPEATAPWEEQFADEAQYWQMRYWLGMARFIAQRDAKTAPVQATAAGTGAQEVRQSLPREVLQPLQRAIDDNVADAVVYLLAYETGLALMEPRATLAQRAPQLQLLDRALDIHPDWSWGYYLRAAHRLDVLPGEAVDWAAVQADLDAGNNAERNFRPLAFPQSFVEEQLEEHEQLAGSRVLAGAVLDYGAQVQQAAPLGRMLERATRVLLERCAVNKDVRLTAAWTRCLCRIARMDNLTPEEKTACSVPLRMVARTLNTQLPAPVAVAQRQDTYEVSLWMDDAAYMAELAALEAHSAMKDWLACRRWPVPAAGDAVQELAVAQAPVPAGVLRGDYFRAAYDNRRLVRKQLYVKLDRVLSSIARFDFYVLRLPYDLSPASAPPASSGSAAPPPAPVQPGK